MNKHIILHLLSAVITLLAVIKLAESYDRGYEAGFQEGCGLNEPFRQYFTENCGKK